MLLLGFNELTIDAKQRVAIPACYRDKWKVEEDGAGWVSIPWPDGSIRLYTETQFSEFATRTKQTLTPDPDLAAHHRALFGFAKFLDMDSVGRVTLPKHQLQKTGLSGEIVMVGALDRLELWSKKAWQAGEAELFRSMPERAERLEARHQAGGTARA